MQNENLELKKDVAIEAVKKLDDESKEYVCGFIKDGYKNLLAGLLVFAGEDKARETLASLSRDAAADLKNRAAALKSDNEKIVKNALHVLENFDKEKIKAALKIARKNSDYVSIRKYDDLFKTNQFLRKEIKDKIFNFSDIAYLNDRSVQKLLREAGDFELAKALLDESEDVRHKIFINMNKAQEDLIRKMVNSWKEDDSNILTREDEIHDSQRRMIKTLYRLEDDGEIPSLDLTVEYRKELTKNKKISKKHETETQTTAENKQGNETESDLTLETIKKLDSESKDFLCNFVKNGYKNLLAELLVFVGEEKTEKTLAELPTELSDELKKLKSSLKSDDEKIAEEAKFVLEDFYAAETEKIDEVSKLVNQAVKQDFLFIRKIANLLELNPLLEKIGFHFENITMLDDKIIIKLLRETDTYDLEKALIGESKSVKEKFFKNMSKRVQNMVEEDVNFSVPITQKEKLESQRKILDTLEKNSKRKKRVTGNCKETVL